tara:strand:- start:93 stop:1142 length:1050 start_codon:yes stop_codon:yes gene_type:complete
MNLDLTRCNCNGAGFCEIYKKEMDAAGVNWCKNTTKEKRERYAKINNNNFAEQKEVLKIQENPSIKYITNKNLIDASLDLCEIASKFDGIVGVPRSGMVPASVIATHINKPLFSIHENEIVILTHASDYGGGRMKYYKKYDSSDKFKKLLFVDDTSCSGKTVKAMKKTFGKNIKFASIFSTEVSSNLLDYCSKKLEIPHILEWNFFNSGYCGTTCFDIDGIFCNDVPLDVCKDEKLYVKYIKKVEPYQKRIPKLFKAKALVTGRLEKFREETEFWLKKHGFNYEHLIMFPTEQQSRRDKNHYEVVGRYKSEIFKKFNCDFFVESSEEEAKYIKHFSGKTVILPNQEIVL